MDQIAAFTTDSSTPASSALLARTAPFVLSVLRILAALLFLEHGTSKFFGFPSATAPHPTLFDLEWFAAAIEFAGGVLLTLGLFSRAAAFVMSGQMAIAYFLVHAPASLYPYVNHGELAVLYCFVFLYVVFAGPGPLSLDALVWKRR